MIAPPRTDSVEVFEFPAGDGTPTMYLRVHEQVELMHETHGAVTLSPGVYEVGRILERDPFTQMVSPVVD